MANTWGTLSWNTGSWGQQNDISVTLTGQQLSSAQGNVGTSTEINSGWGRLTFGENAWGISGDLLVTGIGLEAGLGTGSVVIDVQNAINGQQLNIAQGTITAEGLAEVDLTGLGLTAQEGTVDPGPDVVLSGVTLGVAAGNADGFNEEGWGRTQWGEEAWGASGIWAQAPVTGIGLTANLGSVVATPNTLINLTGIGLEIEEGILDPSPDATVTGIGLNVGLGIGTVTAGADIQATGNGLEIAQGTAVLDANTLVDLTGQGLEVGLRNAVAGASALVLPTGSAMAISLGNENVQSWQPVDTGTEASWIEVDTAA